MTLDQLVLILEKVAILDQKNAKIILNFDHEGVLKTIQREDILYSKKHEEPIKHK